MAGLSLAQLIQGVENNTFQADYEDRNIIRYVFSAVLEGDSVVNGVIDVLKQHEILSFYFQLNSPHGNLPKIEFDFPCEQVSEGRSLLFSSSRKLLVWMPQDYQQIGYRDDGSIGSIEARRLVLRNENGHYSICFPENLGGTIDLTFWVFTKTPERFIEELINRSEIENRPFIQSFWLQCAGMDSLWTHLVHCGFYNNSGPAVFESQQIPHALYFYFTCMYSRTDKRLYAILSEYVAYLVLLSLLKQKTWTHGCWLRGDIHFVNWISGANIFLYHYEKTGQTIFLEQSRTLLDTCMSMADRCLDNAPWYLHDSFEVAGLHETTYYQDAIESYAFGKSKENTLAINTHVWALLALYKFYELSSEEKYLGAYRKGMELLLTVLDNRPAAAGYAVSYGVRDLLLGLLVYKRKTFLPSVIRGYDKVLRHYLLPRLKKRFPRLYMPNGFIERDLTFSFLDQFYHLLNMERLAAIYRQNPSEELKQYIKKSVDYSLTSKMVLYYARSSELSHEFLSVLLLYGTTIDPDYLKHFQEYTVFLYRKYNSLPLKVMAFPYITDVHSTFRTSNPEILVCVSGGLLDTVGVAVNLSPKEQLFQLEWKDDRRYYLQDWNGNRIPAFNTSVAIPGFSSLKILRETN